jgi:alkylated DNA repair dioxygenase AlkB
MTGSMLPEPQPVLPGEALPLSGALLRLAPDYLAAHHADALLHELTIAIAWEQHRVRLFGRTLPAPRLSCWIGDPGAAYTYSRVRFTPRPWPSALQALRARLQHDCGTRFNSVLANLYRDGRDAMGWHSDDEPELGPAPLIASLSLGATRRFVLRARGAATPRLELALTHGSLLLMGGECQRRYRHAVPRTRAMVAPRINLTFRWVQPCD